MSGANGVIDHPNGASVEAMDTGDVITNSSRFTVKPTSVNKQQQPNKPMSPGIYLSYDLFS